MKSLLKLLTAPRIALCARILGAVAAAGNLILAILCLCLQVRGDWLGLALGLALLLPIAAWLLSLRRLRFGTFAYAAVFLIVLCLWTINDMLPCSPGECTPSGFLVVMLPNLTAPSNYTLLLCSLLFFAAHRMQSRTAPQQLSSIHA